MFREDYVSLIDMRAYAQKLLRATSQIFSFLSTAIFAKDAEQ